MSAFQPPPVGQHVHIVDPPDRRAGFTLAHCARCGYSLEFLLRTQRACEVVQPRLPMFWTCWQTPRTEEMARS